MRKRTWKWVKHFSVLLVHTVMTHKNLHVPKDSQWWLIFKHHLEMLFKQNLEWTTPYHLLLDFYSHSIPIFSYQYECQPSFQAIPSLEVSSFQLPTHSNYSPHNKIELPSTILAWASPAQLLPAGKMMGAGGLETTSRSCVWWRESHARGMDAETFSIPIQQDGRRAGGGSKHLLHTSFRKIIKFIQF